MKLASNSLDAEINAYLLSASGHLKESKSCVDGRQVAAFGAAASSALVMMSQAEAAVVMNGGDAPPISVINGVGTFNTGSVGYNQFDMDGDGNNDFAPWGYPAGVYGSGPGNVGVAVAYGPYESSNAMFGGGADDLPKLSAGFTLGPAIASGSWTGGIMNTGNDIVFGPGSGAVGWSGGANERGFIGVRFENASGTHYGWICLQSNPAPSTDISVLAYAYESTPDTAIQVGATGSGVYDCQNAVVVPPTAAPTPIPVMGPLAYGLTSLALGGLGLGGLRRRRNARKTEAGKH